jgi:gamma-glutamyltranspeptidase
MAQVWSRLTLEQLPPAEAIAAPRLHLQTEREPPLLLCEPGFDLSALPEELEVRRFEAPDMYFGGIKMAGLDVAGALQAHADGRREGAVKRT